MGYTAPKFTKFLHDVAASSLHVNINALMQMVIGYCILFQNASTKAAKFDVCEKCPKFIG